MNADTENAKVPAARLHYYEGAYGPTVAVIIDSREALIQIQTVFLVLASATHAEVNLRKLPFIALGNVVDVALESISDRERTAKSFTLTDVTLHGPVFSWATSSSGWVSRAELLEPFIADERTGHQYLTEEGVDDALVEVTFMEGSSAVLDQ